MKKGFIFIVVVCSLIWANLALVDAAMMWWPPPPTIISVAPNSGPADTTQDVTITGTNFLSGANVYLVHKNTFSITSASNIIVVDLDTITATFPMGLALGFYHLEVINQSLLGVDAFLFSGILLPPILNNDYEVVSSSIGELEILDPNPDLISEECVVCIDPLLIDDYEKLAQISTARDGAVTDGVTQLLLRVESESDVTFSIQDGTFDDGSLAKIDECDWDVSVTVSPHTFDNGRSIAFARYRTSSNYASPDSCRYVFLTASNAAGTVSKVLNLERPSVVLVHGLWSNAETWKDWIQLLKNKGFTPSLADYREGAASHFDPKISIPANIPVHAVKKTIDKAKKRYRDKKNIAVTQVDVVAHSMGGLVTRAYTKVANNSYFRKDNFFSGDIHRLITIGTPHTGSELANYLLNNECYKILFTIMGKPTDRGAIEDLAVGSEALRALNGSPSLVLTHTIVGVSSETQEYWYSVSLSYIHDTMFWIYEECLQSDGGFPGTWFVFNNKKNDLIVSVPSQSAEECNFDAKSVFDDPALIHTTSIPLPYGKAEFESDQIFDKVTELLNSDEESFDILNKSLPE